MKTIRLVMLLMVALLAGTVSAAGVKNLKGKKLDVVWADAVVKKAHCRAARNPCFGNPCRNVRRF